MEDLALPDNTSDIEYFKIIDKFTRQTFLPFLNNLFTVKFESGESLELTLNAVEQLSKHYDKSDNSFTLAFVGPNEHPLQQSLYHFEHETLGKFPLFLVPVAQNENNFIYESVFARMPEEK